MHKQDLDIFADSPLQLIDSELLTKKNVKLYIKRDDLLHKHIQGNKWRKLKYNLLEAKINGYARLLTFGGPYSNHLYATAAAAKLFHFKSIGVVRGEEPEHKSPTLKFAAEQGMELYYMDRASYREKDQPYAVESLKVQIGEFYYIPEGGTNSFALEGVKEIIDEIDIEFDVIATACGTGGTLAGLLTGLNGSKTAIGFSSLKGTNTLTDIITKLTDEYCGRNYCNFMINTDYQFGGYAKVTGELYRFIIEFYQQHSILLEPVYTGKMMYGLFDLIFKDYFKPGTVVIALHTGGLQGINGYPELVQQLSNKNSIIDVM